MGFFRLLAITLFLFLLTGYSFMTVWQNRIWKNSYTLWADAVEKYPSSNTANAIMGVVYMEFGMDEKAAEYLERAVEILPYDYQSRNNLALLQEVEQLDKALRIDRHPLKPEDDTIKINLAHFAKRRYKKAEEVWVFFCRKISKRSTPFQVSMVYKARTI
jgi:tetratricopeptide (TPR) repeat protein